ncbi:MAG: bifunctional riboflavin kinase/FAD synthetase [Chloroflexi bacterium]|nr:bifunctional riboflavin kinase/FAD synthetase [Chloroflexota bacterium]
MSVHGDLSQSNPHRDTVLTVGVFDGVHLGHRHLLEQVKSEARKHNLLAGVVTFYNHPLTVLRPDTKIVYICSVEERLQLLKETGVDLVVPIRFDLPLSFLKAREFVSLLQKYLGMKGLVMGPDFAMGHQREGDVQVLTTLGNEMGFTVHVVPHLALGNLSVSSTIIKGTLVEGDVVTVSKLLGRNFALTGRVRSGEGRGRQLGFPTANLEVPSERAIPGDGIYATWAYINGTRRESATSIGVRPTFGPGERTVEAYILDFQGDLYDQDIRLEFARRLRGELAFNSIEALREQIAIDVSQTRRILREVDRRVSKQ